MARMIRKQIVIDAERDGQLTRMAEQLGVSQSEVVRLAIDGLVARAQADVVREEAHQWLLERFRNAPDLGLTDENGRRTWTREELHDRDLR